MKKIFTTLILIVLGINSFGQLSERSTKLYPTKKKRISLSQQLGTKVLPQTYSRV